MFRRVRMSIHRFPRGEYEFYLLKYIHQGEELASCLITGKDISLSPHSKFKLIQLTGEDATLTPSQPIMKNVKVDIDDQFHSWMRDRFGSME